MAKKLGTGTYLIQSPVSVIAAGSVVGEKEGAGPLGKGFDYISTDSYFGQDTWEKGETEMLKKCYDIARKKAGIDPECILSGDLLNQCVSSAFAAKDRALPYFGLYGACSNSTEALVLSSLLIDGGGISSACAITGSHFCSAERQYRFPLEYGGQRTPTSQWTVTGAGALFLRRGGKGPRITAVTPGKIVDSGIIDANNMGAAMAPAAMDTIMTHFRDTGHDLSYYDAVFTGDLGSIGHDLLQEMMNRENYRLGARYMDCGVLMFDLRTQDVHAGGSGCGCCASVLAGHIIPSMERGVWKRVLVCATGALMSPLTVQQGMTIPGICHAVAIESEAAE